MPEDDVRFESISLVFPLPYRVHFLGVLGVWLFALNLHYFHIVRIDPLPFLRYTRSSSEPLLHQCVYEVASVLSIIFCSNLVLFWFFTSGNPRLVQEWEILPILLFLLTAVVFLQPFISWHKRGRMRFLRMLQRILIGGIDPDMRFADVLLADVLTSYAKVLGDSATAIALFLTASSSTNPLPDRSLAGPYIIPAAMAFPYLIRLRQCITEYRRATAKGMSWPERRGCLLNALKYSSAFPVIVISALGGGGSLAWCLFVAANSLFSFYWDVTYDWGLTLLTPSSVAGSKEDYPYGLRPNRYFVAKEFYYVAIGIDLLLRCTWSVKMSPHLDFMNEMEGGLFMLQVLEVLRRWVWVFFRVEKEYVMSGGGRDIMGAIKKPTEQGEAGESVMMIDFRD